MNTEKTDYYTWECMSQQDFEQSIRAKNQEGLLTTFGIMFMAFIFMYGFVYLTDKMK